MSFRHRLPGAFEQCLWMVGVASWLVPAFRRGDWRREWEAELWHAAGCAGPAELRRFSCGCVLDAAWCRASLYDRETLTQRFSYCVRSRWFCLGALCVLIAAVTLASGLLPVTFAIVRPLPYAAANRVATVAQNGMSLSARAGIPPAWLHMWRSKSRLLEGVAGYWWADATVDGQSVTAAAVTEDFFDVLGVGASSGRLLRRGDAAACQDCVVLSSQADRALGHPGTILLNNRPKRVVGTLPERFWFLSRRIAVWSIAPEPPKVERVGAVVRIERDVSPRAAESEMQTILEDAGVPAWTGIVEVSPVQDRVRSVFGSYALALSLAVIITLVGLRSRLLPEAGGFRGALFFGLKTVLALMAVLLAGLEFTRAPSITMIGGTDWLTEPLSTWLYLIASMGVLSWSIHDQRRRCRVCLRRLGLAAHVGCPGCLLLDWAGTEMVCMDGHGMLHVPEMAASWHEAEHWTALDASWQELFARRSR